jgi:hypothetical protein
VSNPGSVIVLDVTAPLLKNSSDDRIALRAQQQAELFTTVRQFAIAELPEMILRSRYRLVRYR